MGSDKKNALLRRYVLCVYGVLCLRHGTTKQNSRRNAIQWKIILKNVCSLPSLYYLNFRSYLSLFLIHADYLLRLVCFLYFAHRLHRTQLNMETWNHISGSMVHNVCGCVCVCVCFTWVALQFSQVLRSRQRCKARALFSTPSTFSHFLIYFFLFQLFYGRTCGRTIENVLRRAHRAQAVGCAACVFVFECLCAPHSPATPWKI